MLTPEALRERAILLYLRLERMEDGKIDAILTEFTALVAEARKDERLAVLHEVNRVACGGLSSNLSLDAMLAMHDRVIAAEATAPYQQVLHDLVEGLDCIPACDREAHAELCPLTNPAGAIADLRRQVAEAHDDVAIEARDELMEVVSDIVCLHGPGDTSHKTAAELLACIVKAIRAEAQPTP